MTNRPMPQSVAQTLRHLAVRCSRLARDCDNPALAKELEAICVELAEQAQQLEADFAIPASSTDDDGEPEKKCLHGGDDPS